MLHRSSVRLLLFALTGSLIQGAPFFGAVRWARAADAPSAADAPDPAQVELEAKIKRAQDALTAIPVGDPERPAAAAEVMRLKKLLHKAGGGTPPPAPAEAPVEKENKLAASKSGAATAPADPTPDNPEEFNAAVARELKKKLVERYLQMGLANDREIASAEKDKAEASAAIAKSAQGGKAAPSPLDARVQKLRAYGRDLRRFSRLVTEEVATKLIAEQKVTFDEASLQQLKEQRKKEVDRINDRIKTQEERMYEQKTDTKIQRTFTLQRNELVRQRADLLAATDVSGAADSVLGNTLFRPDGRIILRSDPDFMAGPPTGAAKQPNAK